MTAELVEEDVDLGTLTLRVARPSDPEGLIDEARFDVDEYMPYWAHLWPAGVALARYIVTQCHNLGRVVELGCGLGLPAIAAALRGADVLATDWSQDAIDAAGANAARNGALLETLVVSWTEPAPLLARAPFDLVLAADVLYERRNLEPLLDLLPQLAGEVLLAEPGRPYASSFLERAAEGWQVEPLEIGIYRLAVP
jgi:predicted nicotinamide N-methyase